MVQESGGFVGFGAMGTDPGYVPVVGADDIDSSVDPEFRMLLKKVGKKDANTKLKVPHDFLLVYIVIHVL